MFKIGEDYTNAELERNILHDKVKRCAIRDVTSLTVIRGIP